MESERKKKKNRHFDSSRVIVRVFLTAIAAGTLLLLLPFSSRDGVCCGLMKALFTATSSTCVTGLVLADTWVQWSSFGQLVILCLIEFGGLGFMSMASVIFFAIGKKISLHERMLMASSINAAESNEVLVIQKKLLIGSLSIEGVGALLLFLRFLPKYGLVRALKLGVFHSVSAFCNAGFDIMGFEAPGSSMMLFATDPIVNLILIALIVTGGIGFLVWDEITRVRKPRKWSVYTKLVLITTAGLILSGWILTCTLEWNNPGTLGNMPVFQKLLAGLFQSVTLRTAGFAAIDQGAMTEAGKAVSIFYMLIGGSSGSTAGGLKTVTFLVIILFILSRMRETEQVRVFKRSISDEQVMNALTLALSMILLAFAGCIVIAATSQVSLADALFETVSALGTVGLTTGITPQLSTVSRIMIICFMFFGRVGILTISVGFLKGRYVDKQLIYPKTNLLIG